METSGQAKWQVIEGAMTYIDLFLYDVKHLSPARHRELTGVDNVLIMENLRKVVAAGKRVILRVPLIPGCNDQPEELEALAKLANELGIKRVDVMAYHRLGEKKYERLGRSYQLENMVQYREEEVSMMLSVLRGYGLDGRLS